jgi:Secretion system C-terminal sorting domain
MNTPTWRSFSLCISLFLLTTSLKSQQTLTTIGGWNAYVHLPASYSSGTKAYPTILFFPGLGEVGTNASSVIAYGPGAFITQGWNGNVVVGGNTVEFIVISLQPPAAYPTEVIINQKIQTIKSLYRVDPDRLYLTGLSHGGWCSTTFVTGDAYGGPFTYASQVAAVVEVEGVVPDDNSPYPGLFDNFALSGGKLLGFEQINDNRGMPTRVNRMNATVPNSAIYVQTNFGGGGHCCWSQFYGGQGVQPGIFTLGGVSRNLYQWLASQSRGAGSGLLPVSLASFSGYKEGNTNKLKWTTASENNNSGFEVQESIDGITYAPIGFVPSQAAGGNSATELNYNYTCNSVTASKQYYYRLKQIDFDNHSKFSNIVRIKRDISEAVTIDGLFPNPANTVVNVLVTTPAKNKISLVVSDIAGKTMIQQPAAVETGANTIQLDINRLAKGSYIVKLAAGDNGVGGSISQAIFVK